MDFQGKTKSINFPDSISTSRRSTEVSNLGRRGFLYDRKEGYHRSKKSKKGFLLSDLHSPKKIGHFSSCDRSITSQQTYCDSKIQNGNPKLNSDISSSRRFCNLSRSKRCIFPYLYSSKGSKISKVRLERQSLPVCLPTVRSLDRSPDFHKDHLPICPHIEKSKCSNQDVLGRLVNSKPIVQCLSDGHSVSRPVSRQTGFQHQDREVGFHSQKPIQLSGNVIRHSQFHCKTLYGKNTKSCNPNFHNKASQTNILQNSTLSLGKNGSDGKPSSHCKGIQTSPAKGSSPKSAKQVRFRSENPSRPLVHPSDHSMDGSILAEPICANQNTKETHLFAHRQQPLRLGRSHRQPFRSRVLDSGGEQIAYQFSGDASSSQLPPCSSPPFEKQPRSDFGGQYNLPCIHKKSGGYSLLPPINQGGGDTDLGLSESNLSLNAICPGSPECSGRQSQPEESDPSNGMVNSFTGTVQSLAQMGKTSNRPLCDQTESQTTNICVPSQGSPSLESGRFRNELGQSRLLCLPSNRLDPESLGKDLPGEVQSDTGNPILAGINLVSRPNSSGNTGPPNVESRPKSSNSTSIKHPARKSKRSEPCRMVTIKSRLLKKGYSQKAVSLALKAKRESSSTNYSYKWKVWTNFCDSFKPRAIDPLHPKISHFIEFITFLHEVRKFSYRTILNYRSAIANTIGSARGIQTSYLVSNPDVVQVIQGIRSMIPQKTVQFPLWDIGVVLSYLRSDVFFPFEKLSFKQLSQKTAFLILLASSRRMSEVHALSGLDHNIEFDKSNNSVILSFLPEFRAKNEKAEEDLKSIEIKSLKNFIENDDPDMRNCPVANLKAYLKKAHNKRMGQRRLFISLNHNYQKDIGKATIARWVKEIIQEAFVWAGNNPPKGITRVHEIRKIAASLSFLKSVSLANVLRSAYWKARSTFTSCYLRDIEICNLSGFFAINSLVANGSVLSL